MSKYGAASSPRSSVAPGDPAEWSRRSGAADPPDDDILRPGPYPLYGVTLRVSDRGQEASPGGSAPTKAGPFTVPAAAFGKGITPQKGQNQAYTEEQKGTRGKIN